MKPSTDLSFLRLPYGKYEAEGVERGKKGKGNRGLKLGRRTGIIG
jgi:hypothetical protein